MDGMTIDEVIKYFDDDAKENEKLAIIYRGNDNDLAEMHKQDANRSSYVSVWLRELKKWRALRDSINMLCDVDCEYPQYRESGTMCDACPIGTVKEYFEEIFGEDINADGEVGDSE